MQSRLSEVLSAGGFGQDADGVYVAPVFPESPAQAPERALRERVANSTDGDYLAVIAASHSIPVMDHEVDRFLSALPHGALILDVGGCWGWHWRLLGTARPDVGVVIVDFVRTNLLHARRLLGPLVGTQIALMHADATALPFPDAGDSTPTGFDGVWSVQVFQHIPGFDLACREACRVLKRGGRFANYSLHRTPLNRAIYRVLGRPFHTEGMVHDRYHLTRADDRQRQTVVKVFGSTVIERYTECLFHPDLKLAFSGREGSWSGRLDARLGDVSWLGRWCARQRSFEAIKS